VLDASKLPIKGEKPILSNHKSRSIMHEAALEFLVDQRIGLSNLIHRDVVALGEFLDGCP
jgi:hypothetical protein